MIQVEIKMLPKGNESRAQTLGLIEIGNKNVKTEDVSRTYQVVLKKTPPFKGSLKKAWKSGKFEISTIAATVGGFDPINRGVYDLLYRALVACGLKNRNPIPETLSEGVNPTQFERQELIQAAGAYLLTPIMDETTVVNESNVPALFPWNPTEWKTFDTRIEELEEARELIDMEIQRLQSI